MRRTLLIATMMAPTGDSGVQTHFNLVAEAAADFGFDAQIVSPQQYPRVMRRLLREVTRPVRMINGERYGILYRSIDALYLTRLLRAALERDGGSRVIVYAQDLLSARAAAGLRRRGYRFRLVAMAHFNVAESYEQLLVGNAREGGPLARYLDRIEGEALPQIDVLAFPSACMRDIVLARHPALDPRRAVVLSNFAGAPRAPPDSSIEGDVISIGTLEPRKNQGFLIRMLAEARRQGHDYRLTLVGRGPSSAEFESLAERLGVRDLVTFAGRIDGAAPLIAKHRVYAHASRYESQGITLLEALSYGRPVLAAPVGGIPEVFSDGVEGCYLDLQDATSAADRLISLLEDGTRYRAMSDAALMRYRTAYSRAVVAPRIFAILAGDERVEARSDGGNAGGGTSARVSVGHVMEQT